MLCVIPIAKPEIQRASELLAWMIDLGRAKQHRALLVFAHPVQRPDKVKLIQRAQDVFGGVDAIKQHAPEEVGWPGNGNAMFRIATEWVRQRNAGPFLWLETDAIPTKAGWLDDIVAAYSRSGKPFMGCLYPHPQPHLNGVMVYPRELGKVNPAMLSANGSTPFDLVRADLVLKHGATTPLICRSLADPKTNTPHSFPTIASLKTVPADCVLYHGCKDGTLIQRLRESRNGQHDPHREPTSWALFRTFRKVRAALRVGDSYYHSGNLGDIVYALYSIQLHGGGRLFIGPEQRDTSPCANPINYAQFQAVLSLLTAQPYLSDVQFAPTYPQVHYDLNSFRNNWFSKEVRERTRIHTLAKMHAYTLGVLHLFREDRPWLTVPAPIENEWIIVQRSPRYHAERAFPWRELVQRYGDRMLFVGLDSEWKAFSVAAGRTVSFWGCKSLLEMAQLIAGARVFMGNQSFPLSLAIANAKPVVVEEWSPSADCRFARESYCGHLSNDLGGICKFVEDRI